MDMKKISQDEIKKVQVVIITDLEMLRHLLNKSGRPFYESKNPNGTVTIQVSFPDFRQQWDFDAEGGLTEEWCNPNESQWIVGDS